MHAKPIATGLKSHATTRMQHCAVQTRFQGCLAWRGLHRYVSRNVSAGVLIYNAKIGAVALHTTDSCGNLAGPVVQGGLQQGLCWVAQLYDIKSISVLDCVDSGTQNQSSDPTPSSANPVASSSNPTPFSSSSTSTSNNFGYEPGSGSQPSSSSNNSHSLSPGAIAGIVSAVTAVVVAVSGLFRRIRNRRRREREEGERQMAANGPGPEFGYGLHPLPMNSHVYY